MTDKPPPTLLDELRRDLLLLKLNKMAEVLEDTLDEAQTNQQGYGTFLATLVKSELLFVKLTATKRRSTAAKFPARHTFDSFNWTFQPGLNVQLVKDLMTLHFIQQGRPVLMLGKPGTGKTHISVALGMLAVESGYRVRFYQAADLLAELYATLADGTTDKLIRKLARLDLLIIDDLRHVPSRPEYASLMYELVEARHRHKSTVVSSNLSIKTWGKVLGNPTLTASMVDRLMDRAHVVNIKPGRSYRSEGPDAPQIAALDLETA